MHHAVGPSRNVTAVFFIHSSFTWIKQPPRASNKTHSS